jgi:hypothetical protein
MSCNSNKYVEVGYWDSGYADGEWLDLQNTAGPWVDFNAPPVSSWTAVSTDSNNWVDDDCV